MSNNPKMKNPCYKCRYRAVGCHATCFLYKEWKNQIEVVYKRMREDRKFESAHIEMVIKTKRKSNHRK